MSFISSLFISQDRWYCDGCHSVLNNQDGFNTVNGTWECSECGCLNDVSPENLFDSEESYREHMGIPDCPVCGSMVVGDAPDATYWFNCKSCGERFYLEEGELISAFSRKKNQISGQLCRNCGMPLDEGEYVAEWENGNNPDAYIRCAHCNYVNFE